MMFLPIVWAGLTEPGLFSWWRLSEFLVARGLATGAVDLSLLSPVQRRVNCNVGPWENVSNGGSRWTKKQIEAYEKSYNIKNIAGMKNIHCNMPTWSLLGLLAKIKCNVSMQIYLKPIQLLKLNNGHRCTLQCSAKQSRKDNGVGVLCPTLVLGIAIRFSGRTVHDLNLWTISPAKYIYS